MRHAPDRRRASCAAARARRRRAPARPAPAAFAADGRRQVVDDAPDAAEEPEAPSRPVSVHSTSFSGGATNITYSRSASAPNFCDHVVRIDDVALRLGHDRAVLEHHALRQQPRERLVDRHEAEVAEHAAEEARVDQVQDRVLDAAAVEIDRAPVGDLRRDRTAVVSFVRSQNR